MKVAHKVREGEVEGFRWQAFVIERTDTYITGVYVIGHDREAVKGEDLKGKIVNAMFEDHRKWMDELGKGNGARAPRRDCAALRDHVRREKLRDDHTWMRHEPLHPWVMFTIFSS